MNHGKDLSNQPLPSLYELCSALRMEDLCSLTHKQVTGLGITKRAEKTGKIHLVPIHPVLTRHLKEFRQHFPGEGDSPVLPIGTSLKQFRRELKRICQAAGVQPFTQQALRKLSINEFESARVGCGALIQGSGFGKGSISYYLSAQRPLLEAVGRLALPNEMLTEAERDGLESQLRRLTRAYLRGGPKEREIVLIVAEAL